VEGDRPCIVGSPTSTRSDVRDDGDAPEDLRRLTRVRVRPKRFLVACARIGGEPRGGFDPGCGTGWGAHQGMMGGPGGMGGRAGRSAPIPRATPASAWPG
jgi:hypothetical protein